MTYILRFYREAIIAALCLFLYITYQQLEDESIANIEITRAYRELATESAKLQEQVRTDIQIVTVTEEQPDGTKTTTKTSTKKEIKEVVKESQKSTDKKEEIVAASTKVSKYSIGVFYRPGYDGLERVQADFGYRIGVLPIEAIIGGSVDGVYIGIRYQW